MRSVSETVKETCSKSGFAPNAFEMFCALMIGGNGSVLLIMLGYQEAHLVVCLQWARVLIDLPAAELLNGYVWTSMQMMNMRLSNTGLKFYGEPAKQQRGVSPRSTAFRRRSRHRPLHLLRA
jgi:hypothetical protein